jgi:hypothetical protein
VNISSRGALFTTDRDLALGAGVEVYIKWPVLLDHSVPLCLIASGNVVRSEPGQAVLAIERYEFRTSGPLFFQRSQPRHMPVRAELARQIPSDYRIANLPTPLPLTRGPETSNTSQRRKAEINDARWERVFQEKFADPEYYSFRWLSHSSPSLDV